MEQHAKRLGAREQADVVETKRLSSGPAPEHIKGSRTPHEQHDPKFFAKCPDKTPRRDPYKARLAVAAVLTILRSEYESRVNLIEIAVDLSCPESVLLGLSVHCSLRGQYMTSKPFKSRSDVDDIPKTYVC